MEQGIHCSGRFSIRIKTNLWTFGNYISPKTTKKQPVLIAASVSKEGWKINHVKIKFIFQIKLSLFPKVNFHSVVFFTSVNYWACIILYILRNGRQPQTVVKFQN
jgi:hypothetical protein